MSHNFYGSGIWTEFGEVVLLSCEVLLESLSGRWPLLTFWCLDRGGGRWGLAEIVNILMPACGVHAVSSMVASWSLLSFLYVSSGQHGLIQLRSLAAQSLFVEVVTSPSILTGKGTQIPSLVEGVLKNLQSWFKVATIPWPRVLWE